MKALFLTLLLPLACLSSITSNTALASQAGLPAHQVVAGECKLSPSGKTVPLGNLDPFRHYGMFAQNTDTQALRIYLSQNGENEIDIIITTPAGTYAQAAYSLKDARLPVPVTLTTALQGSSAGEYVSCGLLVR